MLRRFKPFLALVALLSTGCAAIILGGATAAGTYSYVAGQMNSAYNVNLETAYQASIAACDSLDLPIMEQQKQLSQAKITANDSGRDVWISLRAKGTTITEIAVRVGYLGDETASKRVHDAIAAHL